MAGLENTILKIKHLMYQQDNIRNIGICAHIDHGKTTLSDNLISRAGLISQESSGEKRELDNKQDEQERGITIDAANISMVQEFEDEEYLVNLIDTPGHVDFGGDVTRAMRAVDGAVVVVCAVDGVMPQTKTVLRQALKEHVKPVLFINKVDRLINELRLSPQEITERFQKIILETNKIIKSIVADEFKDEWMLNVAGGSVAFGSAYNNWAINTPMIEKTGITFNDIIEYCNKNKQDTLAEKLPLADVLLDMVVKHLPSPKEAQVYRVPHIWHGDINSTEAQSMIKSDADGHLAAMITKVSYQKHLGAVATCRVYGGTLKSSQEVALVGTNTKARIQQTGVYLSNKTLDTSKVPAGNIAYITGIKEVKAGLTLCSPDNMIDEFEQIEDVSEPVVTQAVKAINTKDLPRLIEVLAEVEKEDPTIKVDINEKTGEQLISGMGELHVEVITNRIKTDKNLNIITSEPIIVYRESITSQAGPVEGKSPNKHNKLYIEVEPLEEAVINAINEGTIKEGRIKSKENTAVLVENGMNKDEAKRVWDVHNRNIFINMTRGVQYLDEIKEHILNSFEETLETGPLAAEVVVGLKFKIVDAKLHEDAVHRGPAQIMPAMRKAIYASIMLANPMLLEPVQTVYINTLLKYMGECTKEVQSRRGILTNQKINGEMMDLEYEVPVAEMFGFAGDIRSATSGSCIWSTSMKGFEILPQHLQHDIITQIRRRKDMSETPQPASYYMD